MKASERARTAVCLAEPDQWPLFLQICGFAAASAGFSLQEYLTQSKVYAELQLKAARRYQNDLLIIFLDFCVEAEALGAKIAFPSKAYPHIEDLPVRDWRETLGMEIPDPFSRGRMPVALEACRLLAEMDDDEHFLVGQVLGPTTIAAQIYGIENLLYLCVDDPVGFKTLLQFTAKVSKEYADALLKVGAQGVMISDPSASPNVFPKEIFGTFVLPLLRDLFTDLKSRHHKVNWLQITGNITSILPYLRDLEIDLITVDSPVSLEQSFGILQGKAVSGNLNPLLFFHGNQQEIEHEVERLSGYCRRPGFILGSGCEIPLDAVPEKIDYLVQLMRQGQR